MCVVCRVSHILDNRRKEKCEAVYRAKPGHANEHVDINLPVFDGLPDILRVEVVGEMAGVGLEATFYFFALFWGEKCGTVVDVSLILSECFLWGLAMYVAG